METLLQGVVNYVDMACCFICIFTTVWILRLIKKSSIDRGRLVVVALPLIIITCSLMLKGFERMQGDVASTPSLLRDIGFLSLSVIFISTYKNKTGEL